MLRKLFLLPLLPFLLPSALAEVPSAKDRASALETLAGGEVRLVWTQVEDPQDTYAHRAGTLMAMATSGANAGEERPVLTTPRSYAKPLFTPDGDRIVFTDFAEHKIYAVNFDGTGLQDLGPGFASDVWRDPATGIDWIYFRTLEKREIHRKRLDQQGNNEMVWNRTPVGIDQAPWFRLSLDGKHAGGTFPWPRCGVADLAKGDWQPYGTGCWSSIAPDNSYRYFHFLGSHTGIVLYERDGLLPRSVPVNAMEGMNDQRVYHPRWSNHNRLLTISGPQRSETTELYLGRFDPKLTAVEQWERITFNGRADYYGDAWISPESTVAVSEPPTEEELAAAQVSKPGDADLPRSEEGLVFLWDHKDALNETPDPADASKTVTSTHTFHGRTIYARHGGYDLKGGGIEIDPATTARVITAVRASGALSFEAILHSDRIDYAAPCNAFSISRGLQLRNFTIAQQGANWVMRLRTSTNSPNGDAPQITLGPVVLGADQHLLVTYSPEDLRCYLDGRSVAVSTALGGTLENWEDDMHTVMGDEFEGGRNWDGQIESIALWSRALTSEEATQRGTAARARIAGRSEEPKKITVEAELIAITPAASPADIAPYRRSLNEAHYKIVNVIEGELEAKEIVVAHWGLLSATPVPPPAAVGTTSTLTITPFEAHPQLSSEHRQPLTDSEFLPLFYSDNR